MARTKQTARRSAPREAASVDNNFNLNDNLQPILVYVKFPHIERVPYVGGGYRLMPVWHTYARIIPVRGDLNGDQVEEEVKLAVLREIFSHILPPGQQFGGWTQFTQAFEAALNGQSLAPGNVNSSSNSSSSSNSNNGLNSALEIYNTMRYGLPTDENLPADAESLLDGWVDLGDSESLEEQEEEEFEGQDDEEEDSQEEDEYEATTMRPYA
jgi:hypothetical protein